MGRYMITGVVLSTAVVAAAGLALWTLNSIKLPEPKPIDPNSMVAVQVVAPREPVPEPGEIMDVFPEGATFASAPRRAAPVPIPAARTYEVAEVPEPVYVAPQPRQRAVEQPRRRESDPMYYGAYVRDNIQQRQTPTERYNTEQPRVRYNAMADWRQREQREQERREFDRRQWEQRQWEERQARERSRPRRDDFRSREYRGNVPVEDRDEDFFE